MSLSGERLARAEARSAQARARLQATAERLRARLSPRQIVEDMLGELRHAGESGATRAKQHPFAVAGTVALLSAFLLRRKRKKATEAPPESLPTKRAEPRRARRSR
jgi:hypothetical protein